MDLGKFKRINHSSGFYLLKQSDENSNNFLLLEIDKLENNKYVINEAVVQLRGESEEVKENEKKVFPQGRSKSKYENIIKIYKFYGLNSFYNNETYEFRTKESLYELLENKYNVGVLGTKSAVPPYLKSVKRDLSYNGAGVLVDNLYDANCNGVTRHSVKFFDLLSTLIDVKEIRSVKWGVRGNEFIVELQWQSKKIILTGLNAGYGGEGPRGLYYVLTKCGFGNKSNIVLEKPTGELIK